MSQAEADHLELHRIHTPDDERVPTILAMSNDIFSADSSTKHGQLSYWKNHLAHPSSFIIYLSTAARPVGFVFVIPRTTVPALSCGASESTHIWLAGVLPEYRKAGCLARMVKELDDVEILTVCTVPTRFPSMWKWLTSRGWTQERELGDGKILLSRSRTDMKVRTGSRPGDTL